MVAPFISRDPSVSSFQRQRWAFTYRRTRSLALPAVRLTTLGSRLRNQSKLLESGDAIVQAQLFGNQAVFNFKDRDTGEVDLSARVGRQRADRNVVEGRAGVRAATFALSA